MNPFARSTGCMVPHCEAPTCNRALKKTCALRRIFLTEIAEARARLSIAGPYMYPDEWAECYYKAYFWRRGI
jgi:hypothetical protein